MTTIRIDEKILKQAKELGLNITKICENALKLYITKIQQINQEIAQNPSLGPLSSVVGRRPHATDVDVSSIDWEGFLAYLEGEFDNEKTRRERFNYAMKFKDVLLRNNYRRLFQLSDDKRVHVLKALSHLAKYLGVYEDFKRNLRAYGLSWRGKSGDKLIIARLTRVEDPNEIFDWIRQVKKANVDFEDFMDLMAITGLRFVEGVACYNLIIGLAREGNLNSYYNEKTCCLEHFKFEDLFLRRSKKAYISFVPKEFVEKVASNRKAMSEAKICSRLKRQNIKLRFGDIREAHGTFMVKYLKEPEINFIHGRVSTSVFMKYYFNPALINDLKQRVFKGINEIMEMIK